MTWLLEIIKLPRNRYVTSYEHYRHWNNSTETLKELFWRYPERCTCGVSQYFRHKLYTLNLNTYTHFIIRLQNLRNWADNNIWGYVCKTNILCYFFSSCYTNPRCKLFTNSFISRFFGYFTALLQSLERNVIMNGKSSSCCLPNFDSKKSSKTHPWLTRRFRL